MNVCMYRVTMTRHRQSEVREKKRDSHIQPVMSKWNGMRRTLKTQQEEEEKREDSLFHPVFPSSCFLWSLPPKKREREGTSLRAKYEKHSDHFPSIPSSVSFVCMHLVSILSSIPFNTIPINIHSPLVFLSCPSAVSSLFFKRKLLDDNNRPNKIKERNKEKYSGLFQKQPDLLFLSRFF